MVDPPIFIIKLLAELYLLAELVPESERGPTIDFLFQKPLAASTLPERRKETRRAASDDGKREKVRIVKMRERGGRGKGVVLRVVIQSGSWRHQLPVDHAEGME
jgi:hypothetical protein